MLTRWLLKTVAADGSAHGGFVWPLEVGAEVTAPDWSDAIECGGGLHGLLDGRGVIAYCGGGISATTDAFALHLLGHEDVAIYDASMNEWGPDASLPMEQDA